MPDRKQDEKIRPLSVRRWIEETMYQFDTDGEIVKKLF